LVDANPLKQPFFMREKHKNLTFCNLMNDLNKLKTCSLLLR